MGRNRKPSGCGRSYEPVPSSRVFKAGVESNGGYIESRNGGSHGQAYLNGEQETFYECDEYPKGMQCALGKWLARAIAKTVVTAALLLALASYLS